MIEYTAIVPAREGVLFWGHKCGLCSPNIHHLRVEVEAHKQFLDSPRLFHATQLLLHYYHITFLVVIDTSSERSSTRRSGRRSMPARRVNSNRTSSSNTLAEDSLSLTPFELADSHPNGWFRFGASQRPVSPSPAWVETRYLRVACS